MNNYLLKTAGLAGLILSLQTSGFAQQPAPGDMKDTSVNRLGGYDEIIIKRKSDKDAKVTVEIRDGQVFVNGKPASEYQDEDLSVRKKKIRVMDGRTFSYNGGDNIEIEPGGSMTIPDYPTPYQGNGGNHYKMKILRPNQAFLGVSSEKPAEGKGAKIKMVSPGSAAEKAGLKAGDLIVKVDEMSIDDPQSLTDAIHKYKPQDKVTVTVKRDGKEQKITATLGKGSSTTSGGTYNMPDMPDIQQFFQSPDFGNGFKGFDFGYDASPKLGISAQDTEDGKGVKVLGVTEESAAAKAGVKEGDIITRFDGKEVSSAPELADLAHDNSSKPVVKLNIIRDGKPMELEIKTPRKLKTANL